MKPHGLKSGIFGCSIAHLRSFAFHKSTNWNPLFEKSFFSKKREEEMLINQQF